MGVAYMDGFVWTHKIQEKNLSYRPKYKVHCYGATILPNCTTFDTALHGVSSNTPAKCEVDQMSGSLDMRGTYPRSDRFLDLQLNVLILEPNDKTISELLYFEIYEQVILKEPFFSDLKHFSRSRSEKYKRLEGKTLNNHKNVSENKMNKFSLSNSTLTQTRSF